MALGPWEDVAGAQVLRPEGRPRAVLHFLGGVYVSPAPQVAYNYVLESLAERGYLVVATPFQVDFDYSKPAAEVHSKFTAAQLVLSEEFGELPQLAAGHSLGALMQVLLCTLYPDYGAKTCASALISFNNKPASDAIPLFEQVFVPAFAPLEPLTRNQGLADAKAAAQALRSAAFGVQRDLARRGAEQLGAIGGVTALAEELDAKLSDVEALASLADQIPDVFGQIARGASDFSPSPAEVKALIGEGFAAQRPLVCSFEIDGLDESDALEAALPPAVNASRVRLPGTHLTPLAARRLLLPSALQPDNFLFDADGLVSAMHDHFGSALDALPETEAAAQGMSRGGEGEGGSGGEGGGEGADGGEGGGGAVVTPDSIAAMELMEPTSPVDADEIVAQAAAEAAPLATPEPELPPQPVPASTPGESAARTPPAARVRARTELEGLLDANRAMVDTLGAAAPGVAEITRLRFALQFPDAAEAEEKLAKMVTWREGAGRPIVEAAAAAVALATAGGGWENEPVRAAAPHATSINAFLTPSNIVTLSADDGNLVYVIRASSIDDTAMMKKVSVEQLVDFFLYVKEVHQLVADARSERLGRLCIAISANDITGTRKPPDGAFSKALTESSNSYQDLYPSLAGPTLIVNLPFILQAFVGFFKPLFPPSVQAKLRFEAAPYLATFDDLTPLTADENKRKTFLDEVASLL